MNRKDKRIPRIFLALASLTGVGIAMTSLLMLGKPSSQTQLSNTPKQPLATPLAKSSPKKTNSVLGPLLPSLSKPPASLAELSLKEPKPSTGIRLLPIFTPSTPATTPKRFVAASLAKYSLKKSVPYVVPRMTPFVIVPFTPRRFVTTSVAKFSSRRFTPFINPAPRLMSVPTTFPSVPLKPVPTLSNPSLFEQPRPRRAEPLPYLSVPLQPIVMPSVEPSPKNPKPAVAEPSPSSILPIQPIATPSFEPSPNKPEPLISPE